MFSWKRTDYITPVSQRFQFATDIAQGLSK